MVLYIYILDLGTIVPNLDEENLSGWSYFSIV